MIKLFRLFPQYKQSIKKQANLITFCKSFNKSDRLLNKYYNYFLKLFPLFQETVYSRGKRQLGNAAVAALPIANSITGK